MMQRILMTDVLVADPGGGVIEFVDGAGEVVLQMSLPPGRTRASKYLPLAKGLIGLPGAGLTVFPASVSSVTSDYILRYQSAANPNFVPRSSAERIAADLERRMSRLEAVERAARKRERAKERSLQVPDPKPDTLQEPEKKSGDDEGTQPEVTDGAAKP